ncbi:MAG: MBL fold metallo-hydrolase [Fibrobacter sp.]|nr:MBL fold metallo-hydrolase [Fibrobacter sp.]
MKFSVLRSGSSGNCTLITEGDCRILIDAGMSQKRIGEVLKEAGTEPQDLDAIVITHLHSDHFNYSTLRVCLKNNISLWVHERNLPILQASFRKEHLKQLSLGCYSDKKLKIGSFLLQPFEISHDADNVTSGFNISPDGAKEKYLAYASDLGHFPDTLIPYFRDSRAIVIESNHDPDLLWKNPNRPYLHKKRVTGEQGHLSNYQAADALVRTIRSSSRTPEMVVLCHLSRDHNTPELAVRTVSTLLDKEDISTSLHVAQRQAATPVFEIN